VRLCSIAAASPITAPAGNCCDPQRLTGLVVRSSSRSGRAGETMLAILLSAFLFWP